MKKILTKEEKGKKDTRNKTIIGVILVILMVLSVVGYNLFSSPEEDKERVEYNGVKFILNEMGMWQFEIQGFGFSTSFNPQETENISAPIFTTINSYAGKPLFFVGEGRAKQELDRNLWNFALRTQDACIEKKECEGNLPIKECSEDNIIIFKEEDYIEITQEDNCIFITSPYAEQTRAADAFLFKILGVKSF